MSALTYKRNDDIESGNLDKMTVYQECINGFNGNIQARKGRNLLAKLVHLIDIGDAFPSDEATNLFFSITKLFQHKDASLRQMVYLAIKELAVNAQDVIMVTSSVMKDVQGGSDLIYKPNAIRTLVRIVDVSVIQSLERPFKTAIVDKYASVSSAALVSSYHILPIARDVVRRWANETRDAIVAQKGMPMSIGSPSGYDYANRYATQSNASMTQYHALALLYELWYHDRIELVKLVHRLAGQGSALRNNNAIVFLIRIVGKIIQDNPSNYDPQMVSYLEGWLRHKADAVNLEAAKVILSLPNNDGSLTSACNSSIALLQAFLGSSRTISRFAAIRILNRYALINSQAVSTCNAEIEALIADPSRAIATYAITTLLKTGTDTSVDRLISQISNFMSDVSDDFRVVIIDAVRSLALKFPAKHVSMLSFLSGTLRDEGGITFKSAVVAALIDMIRSIPECRDAALAHLCEFIEDCEFTELTVRILHLLGSEGPKTQNPTIYVRYIYNRVVLENAIVRAAAVSALAQFGLISNPDMQKSITVLLTRCLDDETDEVRDRAALALRLLSDNSQASQDLLHPKLTYALPQLEQALVSYVSGQSGVKFSQPFEIASIARVTVEERTKAQKRSAIDTTGIAVEEQQNTAAIQNQKTDKFGGQSSDLQREAQKQKMAEAMQAIPELAAFGEVLKSSEVVPLTESETEYVVTAVKHMFKEHMVIQFDCMNTMSNYVLENVATEIQSEFEEEFVIPAESIGPSSTGSIFVSFKLDESDPMPVGSVYSTLTFVSKEIIDPETNEVQEDGFDDSYNLEDIEVVVGDYMIPTFVGGFQHQWDELATFESSGAYQLSGVTIQDVVTSITKNTSMMPLEGTEIPASTATHTLKLFARALSGEKAIAEVKMVSRQGGVTLKIVVRGEDEALVEKISEAVGYM